MTTEIILSKYNNEFKIHSDFNKRDGYYKFKQVGKKMSCRQMAYYRGAVLPYLHELYQEHNGKISIDTFHTMLKCLKWSYSMHKFGNQAILDCSVSLADVSEFEMIDFIDTLNHYCHERYNLPLPDPENYKRVRKVEST